MASYKRQRKHGVRAQTIYWDAKGAMDGSKTELKQVCKFFDFNETNKMPFSQGLPAATAPFMPQILNDTRGGTKYWQRIGRQISMESVEIRIQMRAFAATSGGGVARIIVAYDRQTNGAAPILSDILTNVQPGSTAPGATPATVSPVAPWRWDRFEILYDRAFPVPDINQPDPVGAPDALITAIVDGAQPWWFHHIKLDLEGRVTTYNGDQATGTPAVPPIGGGPQLIQTGGLWIFPLCGTQQPAVIPPNQPTNPFTNKYPIWYAAGQVWLNFTDLN